MKVYDGSTLIGSATVDAAGHWEITPATPLADGAHTLTATATNTVGIVSEPTDPWGFMVDTVPPSYSASLMATVLLGQDTGNGLPTSGSGYAYTSTATNPDLITRDWQTLTLSGALSESLYADSGVLLQWLAAQPDAAR